MYAKKHPLTQFELSKMTLQNLNKFEISPTAKLVLLALTDKYPNIYPSQKRIADDIGISKRSVERAFNELRAKNIILTAKNDRTDTLNCKFTNIFFEIVKLSDTSRQKDDTPTDKMTTKQIIKQKNNKDNIFNFNQKGITYLDLLPKNTVRDDKTPLNDYDTAVNWIKNLDEKQLTLKPIKNMLAQITQNFNLSPATLTDLNSFCLSAHFGLPRTNKTP